ncbi:MAG: hypothetical protein LBC30_03815, partial [Puniceicoccales bacterium]|nr:hypothetical protein [Puniceicoccales bacterium]
MKRQNGIQLGSESFLGWLVCLVICLLPSGLFGATTERTNPLQIGVGDTTLTFSTDGTNNPANDSTDPFTGEGGLMRNIAVSDVNPAHGIYFSGTGFPGKTLTLANGNITYDNTLPYLISATIP